MIVLALLLVVLMCYANYLYYEWRIAEGIAADKVAAGQIATAPGTVVIPSDAGPLTDDTNIVADFAGTSSDDLVFDVPQGKWRYDGSVCTYMPLTLRCDLVLTKYLKSDTLSNGDVLYNIMITAKQP